MSKKKGIGRRTFLKTTGLAGIGIATGALPISSMKTAA